MATNTLSDREWEVRLLFLDEVKDFLADIETEIIGLSDRGLQRSALDKVLRAAHSMKGGAGMMGFTALSELAHQLEDFFKILQAGNKNTTPEIESLFLSAIDNMRETANIHKQRRTPDDNWLREFANPPFTHLRTILGELTAQDEANLLSEEAGEDMRVLMFSTEVDACLERLTTVLADQNSQVLREEFELTSQEFGCLGEMLELPAFSSLCAEISAALESKEHSLREVTTAALEAWRRSQALVLVSQFQALPEHFEVAFFLDSVAGAINSPSQIDSNVQLLDSSFWQEDQTTKLEKSATSLEEIQDLSLDNDISNDIPIDDTAKPDQNLDATIRVPLRQLETLSDRFGELNAERSGLRMQLKRMRDLVQLLNTRMHGLEQSNAQLRDAYDRVATSSEPFIPINAVMATETSTSIKGNIKGDRFTNQDPSSTTFLPYASRFDLLEMDSYSELHVLSYGSLIFERGEEIGLKLEDEQRCKRKDRKSRRYTTAICRTEANGSPRATRQIFSSTWE
jgi:chemotaxis family two-component system sensor histidine kinase/response regulator PixL